MQVYQLQKSEKEVTVLVGVASPKIAGRLQELELPIVLNLEKESSEHFK